MDESKVAGNESLLIWRKPITESAPPRPRGGHTSTLVNTDLVIFGGHSSAGNGEFVCFDDTFVLNLETNTWHKVRAGGDLPSARYGHTASLIGTRIYIFGGRGNKGVLLKDMYFLDTENWCWVRVSTTTSQSPSPRLAHASVVVGTKIVIHGGWNGKNCFDDFWIFDSSNIKWIKPKIGGPYPRARQGHTIELTSDGLILLFGGMSFNTQKIPEYMNDVRALDIETMIWSTPRVIAKHYPKGRYMHTSCMIGNYMFCFGGYTGPVITDSDRLTTMVEQGNEVKEDYVVALNCDTMEWTRPYNAGKFPVSRYGHSMVDAGPQVVIFGGWGANRALNDVCVAAASGDISDSFTSVMEGSFEGEEQSEDKQDGALPPVG